ncbi:uncharacterized protein LOC122088999 [Macadamia integrifolia]|uniref:uncharacterized protein LOC122088999 n=1 Tax=Macadamia integrifolia TaxID=60698 RepID=UPI001C4F7BB5|nr:uncharacterized protein LOC122088999 [Macadamia integrifolia]
MASFLASIGFLWSEWELRALVLTSLFIQALLISLGSIRKHTPSRMIGFLIWSSYLLADWVATLALGVLAKSLMNNSSDRDHQSGSSVKDELKAFWAPFLLLHLGGPDNITAFSLEDNELWLRHLVGLLFEVGTAIYIFIISFFPAVPSLSWLIITILMFMGGSIKYVERTLALMKASRDHFRKSMVTEPDPGPDYAKFVEGYSSLRNSWLESDISLEVEPELPPPFQDNTINQEEKELDSKKKGDDQIELISKAHHFFQIFKRLIVDLILTFHDRNESRSFFMKKNWEEAYRVVEIELGFLYEVLYTKAAVVQSFSGWIFRFTSVSSIIAVSIIFLAVIEKQQYDKIDIKITYVLLSGAIALEFWSLTRLFFTDWTIVWMKKKKFNRPITRFVFKLLSYRRPSNRSRWSNSMAQYNLIEFCLKDHHELSYWVKFMKLIHVKDHFDKQWHRSYKDISEELKKFIFEGLKVKVQNLTDSVSYQQFRSFRGQLTLQMVKYEDVDDNSMKEILDNSIKVEFDESILLWHVATDICYYLDGEEGQSETVQSNQRNSRDISNYMIYLLVSCPFMLTAGIGQIRFGDTCAEAKRFLHRGEIETDKKRACTRLREVDTKIPPVQVKGDRSKSVLFEASRVAKSLLKQVPQVEKRWEIINLLWLEMLGYAASECRGYYHVERLGSGGELLTFVCFIMAHLGIGEQYRVNQGHARTAINLDM